MKRSGLAAALSAIVCAVCMTANIYASQEDAGQANRTFETAAETQAEEIAKGCIHQKEDVCYYKYTVSDTGVYQFTMQEDEDNGVELSAAVYDSDRKKLEDFELDDEGDEEFLCSKAEQHEKGTVLYVMVYTEDEEDEDADMNLVYELQLHKLYDTEQEPNDSVKNAVTIKNDAKMGGKISENKDKDYYCYTAEKNGKAALKFTCDGKGFGWNVELYDSSEKKLVSMQEITESKKKTFQVKKGQKYVIKVYGGETCFQSNEAILDIEYLLNVKIL